MGTSSFPIYLLGFTETLIQWLAWVESGYEEDLCFQFSLLPLLIDVQCRQGGEAHGFPDLKAFQFSLGTERVTLEPPHSSMVICLLYSMCESKEVAFSLFLFKSHTPRCDTFEAYRLYESKTATIKIVTFSSVVLCFALPLGR